MRALPSPFRLLVSATIFFLAYSLQAVTVTATFNSAADLPIRVTVTDNIDGTTQRFAPVEVTNP